ncbi:tol-pal system-associated acyl-CoA thioesterase [Palleronia abyssalis]|uniref:Acyl-CoA thioester hydrolase YbgC n=1 Tax=Palleronia abyssalis TaxID=1501240 RepID=A0A2R8BX58_9RHOB|nr:tol-pal system-associated acyl-CoA thioesterase [Palleronia abyssalis]SPJ24740.1 Acyl-CoA thioester hydrolase YbgC [Palleronia abyssalis]
MFEVTVYYEDTDMGGVVYHANYLKFIERARSDWVAALGVDQLALREAGTVFVVRRIAADFLAPARLGDVLRVSTEVETAGGVRLTLVQTVLRGDEALFRATVEVVAMDPQTGAPKRLPEVIRAQR